MADTLTTQSATLATVPTASIIATDDAGAGGHVQIVKLALSADGSAVPITADANGLEVQGAGVAGTPAGGVSSVQGVAGGTALPVSAASLPLPTGAATETTLAALNTKVATAKTADYDTGAGTDTVEMVGIALPASGGAVAGGTSTNPIRVDPTGGTVQGISAASLPLPTGASTLAEQQTQTTALQLIDDAVGTVAAAIPTKGLAALGTDGTNGRILKTDAAGELQIDVLTLPALVAGTANIGDVDVLTLPALVAGTANIGDVDVLTVPAPLSTTGNGTAATALRVSLASDSTGTLPQLPTALTGGGRLKVTDGPETSGGLTMHKAISAATTNATNVKASVGQVYAVQVFNVNAAARYLKLFNKATAPTVGTDTPVKTLLIPGNTAGAGMVLNWDKGLAFSLGIGYALTTGIADLDTGAVAASEIAVNLDYA